MIRSLLFITLASAVLYGFPTMSFAFGKHHNLNEADPNFVRDANSSVVLDKKRKLLYYDQKPSKKMTFGEAKAYCENLTYLGADDWYLPSKEQMRTLINNKRRDTTIKYAFTNVLADIYWSGTEANYKKAWYFDFDLGRYGKQKMQRKYRAFCVREMK